MKTIWINIILSGYNAGVIALAARGLPALQQRQAVLFGSGAAVLLRIASKVVVTLGAALIGWVGGETMAHDTILANLLHDQAWLHQASPVLGAALVSGLGPGALAARPHAKATSPHLRTGKKPYLIIF
jgi:predicted tellurium resistance membrane protein TerC